MASDATAALTLVRDIVHRGRDLEHGTREVAVVVEVDHEEVWSPVVEGAAAGGVFAELAGVKASGVGKVRVRGVGVSCEEEKSQICLAD